MKKDLVRIEIHLEKEEVKKLDTIAEIEGRSRKNLCETEIRKIIAERVLAVRQKSKK